MSEPVTIVGAGLAGSVPPNGSHTRANVRLVFGAGNAEAERAVAGVLGGGVASDREGGVLAAVFEPGMTGGPHDPLPGTSVDVDRVVTRNGTLAAFTSEQFRQAIGWYREPRPKLRFRLATIHAEQDKAYLERRLSEGRIKPLDPAPPFDAAVIDRSARIVGSCPSIHYGPRCGRRSTCRRRCGSLL